MSSAGVMQKLPLHQIDVKLVLFGQDCVSESSEERKPQRRLKYWK